MNKYIFLPPCCVLFFWVLVEIASEVFRHSNHRGIQNLIKLLCWGSRPWALWGVINLFARFRQDLVLINPKTFPFYANLWKESKSSVLYNLSFLEACQRIIISPISICFISVFLIIFTMMILSRKIVLKEWLALKKRTVVAILVGVYLISLGLFISFNSIPGGATEPPEYPQKVSCLLRPWYSSAGTMMYVAKKIKNSYYYLSHFEEILPKLRETRHASSHPPLASLSLYWIGKCVGVNGDLDHDRIRYLLGLTIISALSLFVIYALAKSMFQSRKIALLASIFWMTMPGVLGYITFSQDILYSLVFNISFLLMYRVVVFPQSYILSFALGFTFFILSLFTYSWCIATTIFFAFSVTMGFRQKWKFSEWISRLLFPLAVMGLLLLIFTLTFHLDYLAIYKFSKTFHERFYAYKNMGQWFMALVGGQIDIGITMGSVVLTAFVTHLYRKKKELFSHSADVLLVCVLCIYVIPILFGPNPLKIETTRCWNWITTIPMLLAVKELFEEDQSHFMVVGSIAISLSSYFISRLVCYMM